MPEEVVFPNGIITEEMLPKCLQVSRLKPRLSWLYYKVFDDFPIVRSTFADAVIAGYSRRYVNEDEDNIETLLFRDALATQTLYPHTLLGMHTQSQYGIAYTIFSTPACFFLPYGFFGDQKITASPYDCLMPALRASILQWYNKDAK